jgi:hypothetical protein
MYIFIFLIISITGGKSLIAIEKANVRGSWRALGPRAVANEANDCTSRREVTFATLLAGFSLGRSPHDEN